MRLAIRQQPEDCKMAEEIFDIAIQSTGVFLGSYSDWERFPPPQGDFPLSADFWIGSLPREVDSDTVLDACEPAGFHFCPISSAAVTLFVVE